MVSAPINYLSLRPYVGCDPGSMGAFAVLGGNSLSAFPVPLLKNAPGGRAVDDAALIELVRGIASLDPVVCCLEHVWGIAGQGAGSAHVFGDTCGAIRLALKSAGIRVDDVSAARWRTALGVHGDKTQSVAMAIKLFPAHAELFTPKRLVRTKAQCEGFAEAVLIAEYARRKWPV